jgi:spermidine synthase
MIISLLSIGLISILGQVVLLRELNVAFYGIELIYLIALGIWLFWTAVGALVGRRAFLPSHTHIALLFMIFGFILPIDVVFIRASRFLFGGVPGAYLPFLEQLTVAVISLFPAGFMSGLLFQWAAKIYVNKRITVAVAYSIESAGGLAGGLLATLFLTWEIQNCSIAFICSLIAAGTPILFLRDSIISLLRWIALTFAALFIVLIWISPQIDREMNTWNHPHLLESRDSPYGRITITSLHNQIAVFENDALSFETEGTDAEYFCHLAALQHPNPQRILILGGGVEGIIREIAQHKPKHIDYVELNPVLLNLASGHIHNDIRKSLKEPNVHITFADPRRFLRDSGAYDLILIGMPEPASGQANRFYTQEFFAQCAERLNLGGILAFRLRSAENIWTLPLARRTASITSALRSVFPETLFLPGTTNIVTASREPLPRGPEIMSRRFQDRKITTRLVSPKYIKYLFTNDRYFEIGNLLKRESAPPNTDVRPACYRYAFMIWLSKFFPRISLIDLSSSIKLSETPSAIPFYAWLILPVVFLISRFFPNWRRILLVAVAGFLGMVLETVLILYYQVKCGVLYQDIGILLMSFMGGLALGALIIQKLTARMVYKKQRARWYGIALIVGFCLLCVVIITKISMSAIIGLAQTSVLLAAAGFCVAGIFAHASLYNIKDQRSIISPLYAADLFGGCVGSLIGSLILIPIFGMDMTTKGMLIMSVFSIILV